MRYFIFLLILTVLSFNIHAGQGSIAEEQKGLLKECKTWKAGKNIPKYLLESGSKYNHNFGNTPTSYIYKVENIDLLISIAISPRAPKVNRSVAISRLQALVTPIELRKNYLSYEKNITKDNKKQFLIDKNLITSKCNWIHSYFVDNEDLSKIEALKVIKTIQSAPKQNLSFHEQYKILVDKYSYRKQPKKYPKHYVTKVGNGGDFHTCKAENPEVFPNGYRPSTYSKELLGSLVKLEKGESYIYEQVMNSEDRKIKEELGDIIMTGTNNRIILFVVKDSIKALGTK